MTKGEERASGAARTWPWWLGFAAIVSVALALTYVAYVHGVEADVEQFDKLVHFSMAGLLAFCLDGAFRRRMIRLGSVRVPLAAVFVTMPVALEECAQLLSPLRNASIGDFAADVAGIAAFTWLSRRFVARAPPELVTAEGVARSEVGAPQARDDRTEES